jgi:hypothetical protein
MKIPRSRHSSEDKCAHLELTSLFYYGLWSSRKGHFERDGSTRQASVDRIVADIAAMPILGRAPLPALAFRALSVNDSRRITKIATGWRMRGMFSPATAVRDRLRTHSTA